MLIPVIVSAGSNRFLVAIVMVLTVVAQGRPATAAAPPAAAAEKLIKEGVEFRLKGDYAQALERFQSAHRLSPSARSLAQMGLAEGDLHRWVEAETHITEALGSHNTPWIENARTRELLREALAVVREHIGLVTVIGPDGAEVIVDGKPAGRLPLGEPLHVAEGKVRMEGRAEGRQPAGTDVVVPGGGAVTLRLDLPLVAIQAVTATPVTVAGPPKPPPPPLLPPDGAVAVEHASWKRPTGLGLLVAGGALLTLGAVWIGVDGKRTSCGASASGTACPEYDTATRGWVVGGIGAAAAIGGGLILYSSRSSRPSSIAISVAPAGAIFTGQF